MKAFVELCLHTLRADCNRVCHLLGWDAEHFFASTRSVQIATILTRLSVHGWVLCLHTLRADCNVFGRGDIALQQTLCLHTLRADCNRRAVCNDILCRSLPPHAPCRLQHSRFLFIVSYAFFASTRSVQIATYFLRFTHYDSSLCLHTLRADCNCRNAQNCNIHFSERVLSW